MTDCPIFQTFAAAKRVSVELTQLLDDIVAQLRNAEPHLFKDAADYEWDDYLPEEKLIWVELGGALIIPVAVKEKGREQASEALMVISYSPLKNPWSNGFMVVTRDGRLREQEAWEACRTNRHAGGRLLEWAKAAQGKNWAQRGWIFALPLRSFKDPSPSTNSSSNQFYGCW